MSPLNSFSTGRGAGKRLSYVPPIPAANFPVQASRTADSVQFPHYPFQPLPTPNGPAPYRFDLSQLLSAADVTKIKNAGVMVLHTVGDTGDYRDSGPQDLVAKIMTQDVQNSPDGKQPAFYYHLGNVIYFAGDIDRYGAYFYETYKDYPGFIVAIPAITIASPTILRTDQLIPIRFRSMGGCKTSCRKILVSWVR
jgi:hypothetical protein